MNLRQARKRLGLTQERLAIAAGLSQTLVVQIEGQPRPNPRWDTICRLAFVLNLRPEQFLPGFKLPGITRLRKPKRPYVRTKPYTRRDTSDSGSGEVSSAAL